MIDKPLAHDNMRREVYKERLGISRKSTINLVYSDKRFANQHVHGLFFLSLIIFQNYIQCCIYC